MKYLFGLYLIALTFGFASSDVIDRNNSKIVFTQSGQNQSSAEVGNHHLNHSNDTTSNTRKEFAESISEIRVYSKNGTLSEVLTKVLEIVKIFPVQLNFYGEHVVFELKEFIPEIIFPKIEKVKKSPLNHFCIEDEGQTIAITKDDESVGLLLIYLVKHKNSITILWCPLDLVRTRWQ